MECEHRSKVQIMAAASEVGGGKPGSDVVEAEFMKTEVTNPGNGAFSSNTENTGSGDESLTSKISINTTAVTQKTEKKVTNFTYPQREWNKCTGELCPFGWIHIACDPKAINDVETLGDITNAADARSLSKLQVETRRYSLDSLLKIGRTIGENSLGYLDPAMFSAEAIGENLLKVTGWHHARGVSEISYSSGDGNALAVAGTVYPIRQPNPAPTSLDDQKAAGFAKMAVRQPKPPPLSVKDQYEQGFMHHPVRQPFNPPDLNGLSTYGTPNNEWPGFHPHNPIRQPRQPPDHELNKEHVVAQSFMRHPVRQPIAAPEVDPNTHAPNVGFKNGPRKYPVRQPAPAPTKGKIQITPHNFKGFKGFLMAAQSPTHKRVTAGGKIVPFFPDESGPPKFNIEKLLENGPVVWPEVPVTSLGNHHFACNSKFLPDDIRRNISGLIQQNHQAQPVQGGNTGQSGNQNSSNTAQLASQNQGIGTSHGLTAPNITQHAFQNQGITISQLMNANVPPATQQMSMPVIAQPTPFHNQGLGALQYAPLQQLGPGIAMHPQQLFFYNQGFVTAQDILAQQAMLGSAFSQNPTAAFNLPADGNNFITGGYQPHPYNPGGMIFTPCQGGANVRKELTQVTQQISDLEGMLQTVGLDLELNESQLKILDGQRSMYDDQLASIEKEEFVNKRRAIVNKRSELRQRQRTLQDVKEGRLSASVLDEMDAYIGPVLGQKFAVTAAPNAKTYAPGPSITSIQQSAFAPGASGPSNASAHQPTFTPGPSMAPTAQPAFAPATFPTNSSFVLGPAFQTQGFQNQFQDSPANLFPGIPSEYTSAQMASGGFAPNNTPITDSARSRQHTGPSARPTPSSSRLNGEAAEWTPNGTRDHGHGNASANAQTPRRGRKSSSEELKKEWEHVSHAEASGSTGHLGDNLTSVAAVSEEVMRRLCDALQSTASQEIALTSAGSGPLDPGSHRRITIRIDRENEDNFANAPDRTSPEYRRQVEYELNRARASSAIYHASSASHTGPYRVSGCSPSNPQGTSTSPAGPATPLHRQGPYRHKVNSSVVSHNIHSQGYLGQMDGAVDYLGTMSNKDKVAATTKAQNKASTRTEPTTSGTKDRSLKRSHHKLSRTSATGQDVRKFWKLVRDEEDEVISKYKAEHPI